MKRLIITCFVVLLLVLLFSPSIAFSATPSAPKSEVLPFVPGSWTLAILPDTQMYAERYPGLFVMQTHWLAHHKDQWNIQYVLQLGDITNGNRDFEWRRAREAFRELDGVLPYALCPGNHDCGSNRAETRATKLNRYFSAAKFQKWPTFGGLMKEGKLENSFHLFSVGGDDWLILALEWAPRDETVAWANAVLEKYPQRKAILITHAYLNNDDTRLDYAAAKSKALRRKNPHSYPTPGSINDGQELWDKLVKRHDFVFVFSGHVGTDGTGYLASKNNAGRMVHQILANYQFRKLGGEGYFRLVEFLPDGKTVHVKTYSPLHDRHMTESDQQFILKLDRKKPTRR